MSIPDIVFLTLVCTAFGLFAVTLGGTVWYCRERAPARGGSQARAPLNAAARSSRA
jgi:hypothetical protein